MTKGGKPNRGIFDVERIREIVALMEDHDLSEVDLQQGDDKIKLRRGSDTQVVAAAPVAAAPPAAVAAPPSVSGASAPDAGGVLIKSPMIGTFYAKPKPDSAPFVSVGSIVNNDTVVCIIEAMKVFNDIPAECSGEIVEILVQDGEAVDFDKPLFRVKPN